MSRMVKYDILRVAASFSIVLLHVSDSYWSYAGTGECDGRKKGSEIDCIILCVVSFLCISRDSS